MRRQGCVFSIQHPPPPQSRIVFIQIFLLYLLSFIQLCHCIYILIHYFFCFIVQMHSNVDIGCVCVQTTTNIMQYIFVFLLFCCLYSSWYCCCCSFFFLISNIHIYVHNCLRFDVCNFPLVGWMSNAAGNQTWVRLWLWMCYFSFVDHLFCIQFVFVCSYLTIIFRMAKSGSQCREQLPSLQLGPLELGCWRAQQQQQHKIATAHAAHVCNAFYYLLFRVIQGWRA